MFNGIILTVNLRGKLSGSPKEKSTFIESADCTPFGSKVPLVIKNEITHGVRIETKCVRKLNISAEVVSSWVKGECPHWEKKFIWAHMNNPQRLQSHLRRFDEGFGYTSEAL